MREIENVKKNKYQFKLFHPREDSSKWVWGSSTIKLAEDKCFIVLHNQTSIKANVTWGATEWPSAGH